MRIRSVFPTTLVYFGWRYLIRHRWQTFLMMIGIMLGVAVVVSIDLATESANRGFILSTEAVVGNATHIISGGNQQLDEEVYVSLRRAGVFGNATPVVSEYLTSPQLGNRPIQLLGVDIFSNSPFRTYFSWDSGLQIEEVIAIISQSGSMIISSDFARQYGLGVGDSLIVYFEGRPYNGVVAGLINPTSDFDKRVLEDVIITDISTAQEITQTIGKLNRIDLILADGEEEKIRKVLPDNVVLLPSDSRKSTVEEMTAAFRLNLTALSMLALLVGLFLIYNSMTFSVVQRRPLFGTLRCLGVMRREIFFSVLLEALVIGVIGSGLGIGLGIIMGQFTIRMVTQTITDLYFVSSVRSISLPIVSLYKGMSLGVAATILAAAIPAWEAASVSPRSALIRSGLETKTRSSIGSLILFGLSLIGMGLIGLSIPSSSLWLGLLGTMVIVIGLALLSPAALVWTARIGGVIGGKLMGLTGRMAPRNITANLSRTAVAVAALMVSVGVTVGITLMIDSFKNTVSVWLEETLQGDIYITPPQYTAAQLSGTISPAALEVIYQEEGIKRVDKMRSILAELEIGPVQLVATDNPDIGIERIFIKSTVPREQMTDALRRGGIIITEPLAVRLNIQEPGTSIKMLTVNGWREFPVEGIFYDYSSSEGSMVIWQDVFVEYWKDPAISAIALRLPENSDPDIKISALREKLADKQQLVIRANKTLRADVMDVFNRTFAITMALRFQAIVVAFIGILSALFLLQIEKQREIGILRAIGLTGKELWKLVAAETGLLGFAAGILALPTGYLLSVILVDVINKRSFGWTIQLQIQPEVFIQAIIVSVIAALIAGIYPAFRLSKMEAANAIRYE